MRENKNACQKRMIEIDQNTTKNTFVRDEQDLQDAMPHRNPVHPVKKSYELAESLKTKLRST